MGDNRIAIFKMISNIVYKSVWENYSAMHRLKLQIRYKIYKAFDAKYSVYRVLFKKPNTIKTVHIFMLNLMVFSWSKSEKNSLIAVLKNHYFNEG